MQKNTLVLVAVVGAALVGVGAGFLIGRKDSPMAERAKLPTADIIPGEHTPAAPGTPNAIAQLVTKDGGGPATPRGDLETALRRSLVGFAVKYDAADATHPWDCVAGVAKQAVASLASTPTVDNTQVSEPPCGGTGANALTGRVRLATRPAKGGGRICEATLSYQLTRSDGTKEAKEVRADASLAEETGACEQAVAALQSQLAERLGK